MTWFFVLTGINKTNQGEHSAVKAIQVKQTGGPEVLEVVDVPAPRPRGKEIVARVAASGVNFIDTYQREGRYKVPLPFILGQEGAGTVAEVGAEVSDWKVGDRVAWTGIMGSYADFVALPADRGVPVPAGISDPQAAAAMLQGMTAHYLTHDTYPLKKGHTALVHAAAGGVGLLLVQMAHRLGARVIGTVSTEEKAELARNAGADEVVLYTKADFEQEAKRLTGDSGVDVVYDSVGRSTFYRGLNVLRPRGMMVLFGGSSGAVPPMDPIVLSQKGSLFLTRPTLANYIASREELHTRANCVLTMVSSGELTLRIVHTYPLAGVARAHRDLEGRKTTGKVLLIPEG